MLKVRTGAALKQLVFFVLLGFFLLPACRKRLQKKTVKPVEQQVQFSSYELGIDGIECKECIKNIVRALRDSKLLAYAQGLCPKNDFSKARITGFLEQKQEFPIQKIKSSIEHENFELMSIKGEFAGIITQSNQNSFMFKPRGADFEVAVVFDAASFLQELPKLEASPNEVQLYGTLQLDKKIFIVSKPRE